MSALMTATTFHTQSAVENINETIFQLPDILQTQPHTNNAIEDTSMQQKEPHACCTSSNWIDTSSDSILSTQLPLDLIWPARDHISESPTTEKEEALDLSAKPVTHGGITRNPNTPMGQLRGIKSEQYSPIDVRLNKPSHHHHRLKTKNCSVTEFIPNAEPTNDTLSSPCPLGANSWNDFCATDLLNMLRVYQQSTVVESNHEWLVHMNSFRRQLLHSNFPSLPPQTHDQAVLNSDSMKHAKFEEPIDFINTSSGSNLMGSWNGKMDMLSRSGPTFKPSSFLQPNSFMETTASSPDPTTFDLDPNMTGRYSPPLNFSAFAIDQNMVCPICHKCFRFEKNLLRHLQKTHATGTGESVLKCKLCNYTTRHYSNMYVHIRTHTGDKPYTCSACGVSFTQGSSLKLHIKSRHQDNGSYFSLTRKPGKNNLTKLWTRVLKKDLPKYNASLSHSLHGSLYLGQSMIRNRAVSDAASLGRTGMGQSSILESCRDCPKNVMDSNPFSESTIASGRQPTGFGSMIQAYSGSDGRFSPFSLDPSLHSHEPLNTTFSIEQSYRLMTWFGQDWGNSFTSPNSFIKPPGSSNLIQKPRRKFSSKLTSPKSSTNISKVNSSQECKQRTMTNKNASFKPKSEETEALSGVEHLEASRLFGKGIETTYFGENYSTCTNKNTLDMRETSKGDLLQQCSCQLEADAHVTSSTRTPLPFSIAALQTNASDNGVKHEPR